MVVVGFVRWLAITQTLSFEWESPTEQPQPGEIVTIVADGGCVPAEAGGRWYREAAFGRWRPTHTGQRRDEPAWWELGPGSRGGLLACNGADGSFRVQIPSDVDWSPVAVCNIDDECVRIEVDLSDS
jgi:hypothetical protein